MLVEEYQQLTQDESRIDHLADDIAEQRERYTVACHNLSQSRSSAANSLSKEVEQKIAQMNMADAEFAINVTYDSEHTPSVHGGDSVNFVIATNKGQAKDSIEKVVSGGELSRIGLALQVINSANLAVPTMIFDEVDVGISGPTASVVGQLLKQLGDSIQTLCVTHLPQVAAHAHNQLFVTKFSDGETTQTNIQALTQQDRIQELARLLAGDEINPAAIENAKALMASAQTV